MATGSGAGSNRLLGYLLTNIGPNTVALTPTTALTGYGTLGGNDSGGFAADITGFKVIRFQLTPTSATALSGYSVSIYVTVLPEALQTYYYAIQGRTPQGQSALPFGGSPQNLADAASGFFPGIPAYAWTLMDGLNDQSGAGASANPMTPTTPMFVGNSAGIVALRAVLTGSDAPAGTFSVAALGIP